MKDLHLIPPTDPRVNTMLAPQNDELLKTHGFKNRTELADSMFKSMKLYGGIGLSANQVGLPFNMFVMGDHLSLENGKKLVCFNPKITSASKETILMKEGCLTFPFIFLSIVRPRKIVATFEDVNGDLQEAHLDGMFSRVFQHEYDHMLGRQFTEHVSKMKLDMAMKKAKKQWKLAERRRGLTKVK